MNGKGRVAGFARPEWGEGVYDLACDVCGATWAGLDGDPCEWCEKSHLRLLADTRDALLAPQWLAGDHGPRYDELAPDDRAVWDRTRGVSGEGSMQTWIARLARAVETGLITEAEAQKVTARVKGRRVA